MTRLPTVFAHGTEIRLLKHLAMADLSSVRSAIQLHPLVRTLNKDNVHSTL